MMYCTLKNLSMILYGVPLANQSLCVAVTEVSFILNTCTRIFYCYFYVYFFLLLLLLLLHTLPKMRPTLSYFTTMYSKSDLVLKRNVSIYCMVVSFF